MLLKSLLIAICFAVCIDRSFEDFEIINCKCAEDCLGKVMENKLNTGFVPILVTKNYKDDMTDKHILKFFEDNEVTKILKVNVKHGGNNDTAKYLYHVGRDNKDFPFVAAIKNNRLLKDLSIGYNDVILRLLLHAGRRPVEMDADYVQKKKYTDFTSDMGIIIEKTKNKKMSLKLGRTADESQGPEDVLIMPDKGVEGIGNWFSILHEQPQMAAAPIQQKKRKRPSPTLV